jgi:hypothetical protein
MKRNYARCLCSLLAVAAAAPAASQNLLVNPGFATDLEPWLAFNHFGLTIAWSPLDAGDDPASGSVEGTVPADGLFRSPPYVIQCIAVDPDTPYIVGVTVLVPSDTSDPEAGAGTLFNVYPNDACTGNPLTSTFGTFVYARDAWIPVRDAVHTGAEGRSIQVNLVVYAPDGTLLRSYFDDAVVFSDRLFVSNFD